MVLLSQIILNMPDNKQVTTDTKQGPPTPSNKPQPSRMSSHSPTTPKESDVKHLSQSHHVQQPNPLLPLPLLGLSNNITTALGGTAEGMPKNFDGKSGES